MTSYKPFAVIADLELLGYPGSVNDQLALVLDHLVLNTGMQLFISVPGEVDHAAAVAWLKENMLDFYSDFVYYYHPTMDNVYKENNVFLTFTNKTLVANVYETVVWSVLDGTRSQ